MLLGLFMTHVFMAVHGQSKIYDGYVSTHVRLVMLRSDQSCRKVGKKLMAVICDASTPVSNAQTRQEFVSRTTMRNLPRETTFEASND